jgi:hypothetical protein
LAKKTYPAVQELHAHIKDYTDKHDISPISHESNRPVPFSHRYRKRLIAAPFESIASMIETFLAPNFNLSAFARITLRSALSNPSYFASMILRHFYHPETLDLLLPDRQRTDDVVSEYRCRKLPQHSSLYPLFHALWKDIRERRHTLRKIATAITDKRKDLVKHVVVHRVRNDKNYADLMSKKIILNPSNPSKYSDSEFHKMYSENSYIVGDTAPGGPIRIHLFVNEYLCRRMSNKRIIAMLFPSGHGGHRSKFMKAAELWLVGVHIVNLHRIQQIENFMKAAAPILLHSAKVLRHVSRSDEREDSGVRIKHGSRMFEIGSGYRLDQVGSMQSAHNFKKPSTDPIMKYNLMAEDDYILDGVKKVKS